MELALSLGDTRKQSLPFLDKPSKINPSSSSSDKEDHEFRMVFGGRSSFSTTAAAAAAEEEEEEEEEVEEVKKAAEEVFRRDSDRLRVSISNPPLQLDLLPFSPVQRSNPPNQLRFRWPPENMGNEMGFSEVGPGGKTLDPIRISGVVEAEEAAARLSASPLNSVTSSFQLDFGIRRQGDEMGKRVERSVSRASDDDENGSTRKKLRLSKEQSAFLEESFKEHNTLNPKQKIALAKQLNLRPRQVEVWFQNRRARTKLKQTEVDCEYLKRCCESLNEENRRLQKELQELRALKTSRSFYMQLPATTLTMCPSCERIATATTTPTAATTAAHNTSTSTSLSYPFGPLKAQTHQGS